MREVLFVAGETSGDLHAARVAAALRRRTPDLPMAAVGGARLAAEGVELLEHSDHLAVIGLVDAVRQFPHHARLLAQLRERLRSGRTGLLVLVDYPGFNLRLARVAHEVGVPVLYYITPQVWAWAPGRLRTMARTLTRAAVILPFEESLLRAHGIDATYVGHPLLDAAAALPTRAAARAALGLGADDRVLALFPGSRASEIAHHLDTFIATARLLEQRVPGLKVIVSAAPGIAIDPTRCPYPVVAEQSFTAWRAADAALAKSGTSTLEAALAECPLIVAYRTNILSYAAGRVLVRVKHLGLVNLIAGRAVAPEFIQSRMRADAMASALAPLLDPASRERATMLEALTAVRFTLGTPGAAERVAELALRTMR